MHGCFMLTIGLTGGVGMGKSVAAELLEQRGCFIIDTDLLARKIVEPGEPALAEIRQAFGDKVISPEGRLRRDELAKIVFADAARREQLEGILHPRIRELWQAQAKGWEKEGRATCVVVIPLLFETQAEGHFQKIICVACSASTQAQRLRARGWSDQQIQQRIESQWPIEQKMSLSHFVIWTEGALDVHAAQIDRILNRLS